MNEGVRLGPLERTSRAFFLESSDAMRGDIVRALVEYITNADDAYQRRGGKGRILVEVEHKRGSEAWHARVRDRATGMSLAEMKERIGRQGVRASGFEAGAAVRGNRGLGAKDPAVFGRVTFETIKDGEYAWLEITDRGEVFAIKKARRATKEDRGRLGIPGNNSGVVTTITVTHPVGAPRHENLKRILQDHVQLRDILQDPDREVSLLHASQPDAEPGGLRYVPPKVTERLHRKDVPVPGYAGGKAEVRISEAEEPFPDLGRNNPQRRSGLVIKGEHAVYEATLFGFESNPHAHAFTGAVRCPYIDELARDFDDRLEKGLPAPTTNPQPIIGRARIGLVEDHPFYQALRKLGEDLLRPLIEDREKRARERTRAVENSKTTKLLAQLAKEASKFMEEAAEEEDIELPPVGPGGKAPALAIIPGAVEMTAATHRTLTVMAARDGLEADTAEVTLELAPPGVVSLSSDKLTLQTNKRRDDVLSDTVKIVASQGPGATLLKARLNERYDDCAIEVLEPETPPEPIPPAELQFEKPRYRVGRGRVRVLTLLAPLNSYVDGTRLKVTSNDRSVVVLDGGQLTIKSRPELLAMTGTIRVEGRVEGTARVTATDWRGLTAGTEVSVQAQEDGGAGFKIELVDQVRGDQRAQWNADFTVLEVMGEHPAVKPYLGDAEKDYPGQDTIQYKVLQAELVGDAVVRRMLQQKYGEDEIDVLTLYVTHTKLLARFMARAHKLIAQSS